VNQNEVAVEVAKREGGKQEQSIAQIKETIKCYNALILKKTGLDIAELLRRIQKSN